MEAKTRQDMKKTESDATSVYDEVEDLTLFADESFDTEDVDLFEFTGEDDSPLTRLKSIILSLDWEINDDILQELSDEVVHLQQTWEGDKVAAAYLQGLDKVGRYLRSKGAYAHPNSIKLLLTFYYNFEKIVSSPSITGDEITTLLKGDVRKFKILQYQIGQFHGVPETDLAAPTAQTELAQSAPVPADAAEQVPEADNHLKMLKAAILSLDWEVTDESLQQFNAHLQHLEEELTDNKPALVLTQGLYALGGYIADEKAGAHPDSFTLMDSFFDGLSQLYEDKSRQLDQQEVQNILVDRISRLNTLKAIIAERAGATTPDQVVDEVVDQLVEPEAELQDQATVPTVDSEAAPALADETAAVPAQEPPVAEADFSGDLAATVDSFFDLDEATPAMETATTQYPDEVLPPDAIQPLDDAIPDSLIEEQLASKRGVMPALSETEEAAGFREETEQLDVPAQSDLEEQLDLLFADEGETAAAGSEEKPTPAEPEIPTPQTVAALADVEAPSDQEGPPLDDAAESETADTIASKLDDFFTDIPEDAEAEKQAEAETTDNLEPSSAEAAEEAMYFGDADGMTPALADSGEETGFSESAAIEALEESPLGAIEEKLDFFFGDEQAGAEAEETIGEAVSGAAAEADSTEAGPALEESLDELFGEEGEAETGESVPSALADADTGRADLETEPAVEEGLQQEQQDLEEGLDLFFADTEQADEQPDEEVAALTKAIEEEIEGETVTPALTDADMLVGADTREEEPLSLDDDVDELFSSYETTDLDESVDSLFEGGADEEDENAINLATLGAALPSLVNAPSASDVADTSKLIESLKANQQQTAQQKVLLELLDSVLRQLSDKTGGVDSDTEQIIGQLYESVINRELSTAMLPEIVQSYTGWMEKWVTSVSAAGLDGAQAPAQVEELPVDEKDSADGLRAEIRSLLKEELAPILNELKK